MLLSKAKRFIKSCATLGIKQTGLIITHRMKRNQFIRKMHDQALMGHAHHSWPDICKRYNISLDTQDASKAFSLSFIQKLFADISQDTLLASTDMYIHDKFEVLGSDWYQLDDALWHTDIRLKQQGGSDYLFSASAFYADIIIESGMSEALHKDIKVPWELSRLQHLPLLAYAYKQHNNPAYINAFMRHVKHWKDHNPYLLGINWLCPMEVALRAISLVVAFNGFKHTEISNEFLQEYTALLYDHMIYLEHNWEWYDGRTSNHYLSNLVGYLYVCWFFQPLFDVSHKIDWCRKQLIDEMEKQIFDEGTSYEGSTRYHLLVTELFYHAEQLCFVLNKSLPQAFHHRLQRMRAYINWCMINKKEMITIGDHDAGMVTCAGLPKTEHYEDEHIKHYDQFGLSFYKDERWHISLRHHHYESRQPSGHFHNDVGSVTIAIDQIPVVVDPGSYVYTASALWRNYFRSAEVHNMMHIKGREPVPFDERMFALAIPEHTQSIKNNAQKSLQEQHRLYARNKLNVCRTVNIEENVLYIHDIAHAVDMGNEDLIAFFNFTFDHTIALKKDGDSWIGYYNNELLFRFSSLLNFQMCDGYVSPTYGIKKETMRLIAQTPLEIGKEYACEFVFSQDRKYML